MLETKHPSPPGALLLALWADTQSTSAWTQAVTQAYNLHKSSVLERTGVKEEVQLYILVSQDLHRRQEGEHTLGSLEKYMISRNRMFLGYRYQTYTLDSTHSMICLPWTRLACARRFN